MKQKILTIQEIYRQGAEKLKRAKIAEADLDAWYLLEYVTGISKALYYADPDREIDEEKKEKYNYLLEKRSQRIPLQHLTKEQEFMGINFFVNEHVLIPRQDTETLVEEALKVVEDGDRILDMCTGSGCILLSILMHAKADNIKGTGTDISEEALKVAKENAENLCIKTEFVQGDLFENIPPDRKFDLIVSNPPYICTSEIEKLEEEVRLHDPYIALDGKEDGLYFYRKIIKDSVLYMNRGGRLMFEIGCEQGKDVEKLMKEAGYTDISIKKDLAALDRVVIGMYNGK
ncbi:MAG: peptide chain release factor N(5)-glutamine methyltransferase [Lachnospiraceae bacterium]